MIDTWRQTPSNRHTRKHMRVHQYHMQGFFSDKGVTLEGKLHRNIAKSRHFVGSSIPSATHPMENDICVRIKSSFTANS